MSSFCAIFYLESVFDGGFPFAIRGFSVFCLWEGTLYHFLLPACPIFPSRLCLFFVDLPAPRPISQYCHLATYFSGAFLVVKLVSSTFSLFLHTANVDKNSS